MNELWSQLGVRAGLSLSLAQHALLERYLELLLQANASMNLTRIDDIEQARAQHVGDALTVLPYLPKGPFSLADVGSGGGVPGIPLAIVRPDAQVLLVESTQKKAEFLRYAAAAMALNNVKVTIDRAESLGRSEHRESFEVVVARALAAMRLLVEWCLPLAKVGGVVLAMKGPKITEELPKSLHAIRVLSGQPPVVHNVQLPGAEGHVIVEVKKAAKTDMRYPRPASQSKNRPL